MPARPTSTASGNYAGLNAITDPLARGVIKRMMDRINALEGASLRIGEVNRPLDAALDGSRFRAENFRDPANPQDLVTKAHLEKYIAAVLSTLPGVPGGAAESGNLPETPSTDPADDIPDHGDVVANAHNAHGIGPGSSDEDVFRFVQDVAWELAGLGEDPLAGLLLKSAGAGIFTCAGETYSYTRVCYSNGHIFDILIDGDPGGARLPSWGDDGFVDVGFYHVATDPSSPC